MTVAADGPLRVEQLEVGYGSTFVLAGIDFEAAPGAVVGIIGPNGSGKSTLLKAVARVLDPRAGRITLGGEDIGDHSIEVAFVPQREEVNWDFPVSALDVVMMGRYRRIGWLRRPSRSDRGDARAALDRFGLGGMGGRHISQFSGGQQQRIFLARALFQEPAVVILDEPFTGIDTENRVVFRKAIADFSARGSIVLMSTHDLDEVTANCSHVLCLNRRQIAFGPLASTYTPENLRATFQGQIAVFA